MSLNFNLKILTNALKPFLLFLNIFRKLNKVRERYKNKLKEYLNKTKSVIENVTSFYTANNLIVIRKE
tara:strand:- start:73 stop:276 length:204 start_codon:yes stop_codon:yes gene_type:complete